MQGEQWVSAHLTNYLEYIPIDDQLQAYIKIGEGQQVEVNEFCGRFGDILDDVSMTNKYTELKSRDAGTMGYGAFFDQLHAVGII